ATHTTCTKEKLIVRKEFGCLTIAERKAYIKAVKCLIAKPSKLSAAEFPGAKTRYDDFVIVHLQQTLNIHGTASFLTWHRYFTWAYERALREECAYKGAQPYWNWGKYPDLLKSPIFDGTDVSMGSNGDYVKHNGSVVGTADVFVPGGNGGGCVSSGPFKNMTINVGPLAIGTDVPLKPNPQADGLGYNPRCIRRDVTNYFTKSALRVQDIVPLITTPKNISAFQDMMQTDTKAKFGVHSGGHYSIWGDPGGDFFISPGDPAFWLHHGMIDRTWWIWQNLDPAKRVMAIAGKTSLLGDIVLGTLDDPIDLSVIGAALKIKDLVSSTAGLFCYVY
ncbi:Di-copper centre-containing protein, partial [Amniculicola lignicola CBS 123094]